MSKTTTIEPVKLEFIIKASPRIIYGMLTTPSGFASWYADKADENKGIFTFNWDDGEEEQAQLLAHKENVHVAFKRLSGLDEGSEVEFKIEVDDLTNDVALLITDYSTADDPATRTIFWEKQIQQLMQAVGS